MDPQAMQQMINGMDFNPEMWDRLMQLMQSIRQGSASLGGSRDMAIMQNPASVTYQEMARGAQNDFSRQANPWTGLMELLGGGSSEPAQQAPRTPSPGQIMSQRPRPAAPAQPPRPPPYGR